MLEKCANKMGMGYSSYPHMHMSIPRGVEGRIDSGDDDGDGDGGGSVDFITGCPCITWCMIVAYGKITLLSWMRRTYVRLLMYRGWCLVEDA